ncbi:major facilitator superfamily domain-containing protein [Phascolomyces articulosus]|uniref:Major facilitator superfamily domain-containing protein n=1 Tax=Phascolomyces articulosus TaxID=60185 RepID=A0AAD5K7G2_9FUNG|nr:major facilitator superfamily domain-containing protein [Phascolomyces articulosus]
MNQDVLSRSYTDSLNSYLSQRQQEEDHMNHYGMSNNRRPSYTNASVHSNLSNMIISQTPSMTDYYQSMTGSSSADAVPPPYHSVKRESVSEFLPENAILSRSNTITTAASIPYHGGDDGDSNYDAEAIAAYDDDEPTPLPRLQMFIVCIILFSEPLTSTILFPFIYFMLKDFNLSDDETEIGAYAGWITSIFFFAQLCTAMQFGKYSDKHGRRPVLLLGLIGNSISACSFGLSKSIWWAMGSRAFCGLVNGNAGVARSMLTEITDATNRATAFSLFGFCWGIGIIASPALGGYLCNPVERFPGLFGGNAFLKEYPYFLPCFVSSLGSLFGFFIGYFYLKESNPAVLARREAQEQGERQALLGPGSSGETGYSNDDDLDHLKHQQQQAQDITPPTLSAVTKTSYIAIFGYAVFAFHAMVFDEVLPLYFSTPRYAGGLGTDATEIAKALSIAGLQQLVAQFAIYPRLNRYIPTLAMARLALCLFFPVYILFPELTTLRNWLETILPSATSQIWAFRAAYMILISVRYFGCCLAFTSMMVLVSNSADPSVLGFVNGLCQSCLSLVRGFGKYNRSFL